MNFANYNAIKERITEYVTKINDLKYKGYEKDLAYLKGLCNYYRRTMGPKAEESILRDLDNFAKKLKLQEFYADLKKDVFFKKVRNIRKNINTKEFNNKEQDIAYLDDLLNEYIVYMWNRYGNEEIDGNYIITVRNFNIRLANIVKIIFNDVKKAGLVLNRR